MATVDVMAPHLADLLDWIELHTGAHALGDPAFMVRTDMPCTACQLDAEPPLPTALLSIEGEEPRRLCLTCAAVALDGTLTEAPTISGAEPEPAELPRDLDGYVEWRLGRGHVHAVVCGDSLTLCADPAPGERYRIRALQLAPVCERCVAITTQLAQQLDALRAGRNV